MIAELYRQLKTLGVKLRIDGGLLKYWPAEKVTPELRELMKAHKAELMALVRQRDRVNREIQRFQRVAKPRPDGHGWYDPTQLDNPIIQEYLGPVFQIRSPDDLPAYWREHYEERAAIRHFEGKQALEHAEAEAFRETLEAMRQNRG